MNRAKGIPGVSIYKPKGRNGPQHKWIIAWYEGDDRHVESVSTHYETTRRYALKIAVRLDQFRLGLTSTREEKIAAYAALPLLEAVDDQGKPVEDARLSHLGEYLKLLTAKKRTPKQVQMVGSRVARLFRLAEFEVVDDITTDGIELGLGQLSDEEELADTTCRHYAKTAKQFTRWMRRSGRARFDELEDLELPSILEMVHLRRALTDPEACLLMEAAEKGGVYLDRITGHERAMVYLLAIETGLRANELRTLTPESFHLDENSPCVIVAAVNSKHRKRDEQPVRRDVAVRLREFLKGKVASERIWVIPDKPVKMMEADRKAAGILYETAEGFADFHALRHTFCTRIGRSGATIKDAQVLMRHSDIRQTARYLHSTLRHQVNVLEALPPLIMALPVQQRATGTDGVPHPFGRAASPGERQRAIPERTNVSPYGGGMNGRASLASLGLGPLGAIRATEPKVAGSTPARCIDPNDLPKGGNDAATPPPSPADPAVSAPGIARAALDALQGDSETLAQIHAMLAELLDRQRKGGQ